MNKEILRLAIPNILSNISVPLLSTADTAIMGRFSEAHIGAVGIASMIFNFIYWNFGFLRMGTTGMTAQAFGKRDVEEMGLVLGRAGLVGLILAVLVFIFQTLLANGGIYLMNVHSEQVALVSEYFFIRIWAAPATLMLYSLFGWFFGMQNAIYPLVLTLCINIINIALSFLLVFEYGLEVDGVAWGTVVAQYFGLLLAFILLVFKYREIFLETFSAKVLELEPMVRFLRINSDIFLRTVCITFVFGFFYSQSSKDGPMILAANVILLQYLNWMSYGVDGFAYATESLVGKYYGAKNEQQLSKAIRYSFIWGFGLAALYAVLYGVFGEELLTVFTNQLDVQAAAIPFLFWLVLLPIIGTPSYIWDGVYIGLTASKAMRNSMLISMLIFLFSFWLAKDYMGNHGIWMAMLVFLGARGIIQWILFKSKGVELK